MANAVSTITGGSKDADFSGGGGPDFTGQYDTTRGDIANLFSPYIKAGTSALSDLQGMLEKGFQPGDLTQDPGYQFQLEQGNRAASQNAGLTGSPFGGNTLQALSQFNQGLAATTYNNAFARWNTQVQNLAGLAGLGANAAGAQSGNLAALFAGLTGAQANIYGSQAGVESSRVGRGGSFFGAGSNLLGI